MRFRCRQLCALVYADSIFTVDKKFLPLLRDFNTKYFSNDDSERALAGFHFNQCDAMWCANTITTWLVVFLLLLGSCTINCLSSIWFFILSSLLLCEQYFSLKCFNSSYKFFGLVSAYLAMILCFFNTLAFDLCLGFFFIAFVSIIRSLCFCLQMPQYNFPFDFCVIQQQQQQSSRILLEW